MRASVCVWPDFPANFSGGPGRGRLKEAAKLGFRAACLPATGDRGRKLAVEGMRLSELGHLSDLVQKFMPERARWAQRG